jgi:hypothetical protein
MTPESCDRIKHDRFAKLGRDLAQDLDRFGFQSPQMRRQWGPRPGISACRVAADSSDQRRFRRACRGDFKKLHWV